MKHKRHEEIISIVNSFNIETQDDLIDKLRARGYEVTQATVSRDIRELKLTKTATGNNKYKYAVPSNNDAVIYSSKYQYIVQETIISVDYACNMIVFKTLAGMAQAAAAAIDAIGWNELVGTIAGDDTIFVVMRSEEKAKEYTENFKKVLNLK